MSFQFNFDSNQHLTFNQKLYLSQAQQSPQNLSTSLNTTVTKESNKEKEGASEFHSIQELLPLEEVEDFSQFQRYFDLLEPKLKFKDEVLLKYAHQLSQLQNQVEQMLEGFHKLQTACKETKSGLERYPTDDQVLVLVKQLYLEKLEKEAWIDEVELKLEPFERVGTLTNQLSKPIPDDDDQFTSSSSVLRVIEQLKRIREQFHQKSKSPSIEKLQSLVQTGLEKSYIKVQQVFLQSLNRIENEYKNSKVELSDWNLKFKQLAYQLRPFILELETEADTTSNSKVYPILDKCHLAYFKTRFQFLASHNQLNLPPNPTDLLQVFSKIPLLYLTLDEEERLFFNFFQLETPTSTNNLLLHLDHLCTQFFQHILYTVQQADFQPQLNQELKLLINLELKKVQELKFENTQNKLEDILNSLDSSNLTTLIPYEFDI